MADVLKQIVDNIKDSNNVLVTVSTNPSVDELSAALGITLTINKLNKHATAVFSGAVPPAIEFLKPEKTFENTVDSLRDFIIALDKEKADHLRYKVVDDMVKIFITPYRTTINEKDLDFSQGDYNVETVLAIGVKEEADLDHALESHGRILHDATVVSISLGEKTNLGGVEWNNPRASSYSEVLFQLADALKSDKKIIDEQIATAFLTGIVAATDRFSNSQTSSSAMTAAAQLMAAGANQQLIATKLQESHELPEEIEPEPIEKAAETSTKVSEQKDDDAIGALSISHEPEGDVDEVKKIVQTKSSNEALEATNQKLQEEQSADAAAAAEQKLAEQLSSVSSAQPPDELDALQNDIIAETEKKEEQDAVSNPDANPISVATPDANQQPSFGGVLNATTEQAAADKQRAINEDRNRVLLSHDTPPMSSSQPTPDIPPLNSTVSGEQDEPTITDVFAESGAGPNTPQTAVLEPVPVGVGSPQGISLQPIDTNTAPAAGVGAPVGAPSSQDEARAAIDAAFNAAPAPQELPAMPFGTADPMAAAPLGEPQPQANDFSALPPLPPAPQLPPMPDFSTLPPLPDVAPGLAPNPLESTLPPAEPAPAAPVGTDPAQFRIPGQ